MSDQEFFSWLISQRERAVRTVLLWCSDFRREDAEDVFAELCKGMLEDSNSEMRQPTLGCLYFSLRRAKENYRRGLATIKRGGQHPHLSIEGPEGGEAYMLKAPESSELTSSDHDLLDLILSKMSGRLLEKEMIILEKMVHFAPIRATSEELVSHLSERNRELLISSLSCESIRRIGHENALRNLVLRTRRAVQRKLKKAFPNYREFFRG